MLILLEHLPSTGESAWFRARNPKSWWWTPTHDFLALAVYSLQAANWQRAGGKGNKPVLMKRPDDTPPEVKSSADLAKRRAAHEAALKARRARHTKKGA